MHQLSYGDIDYWEDRYRSQTTFFEWYQSYWSLQPLITSYFPKQDPVLQIGVGTSQIQDNMVEDGYKAIINIDYSEACINYMKKQVDENSGNSYYLMDACNMQKFEDCVFRSVFDKGTVDAIMCSGSAAKRVEQMIQEIYRVLKDGGIFIIVTYGEPQNRLEYLKAANLNWQISIYCISKPTSTELQDGEQAQRSQIRGPFKPDDKAQIEVISQLQEAHFAYVCEKGQLKNDCSRDISRSLTHQARVDTIQDGRNSYSKYVDIDKQDLESDKEILDKLNFLEDNDRLAMQQPSQKQDNSQIQGDQINYQHQENEKIIQHLETKLNRLSNSISNFKVQNKAIA